MSLTILVPPRSRAFVRNRVKPGGEEGFVKAHQKLDDLAGFSGGALVKTGKRTYCLIGVRDKFDSFVAARPK